MKKTIRAGQFRRLLVVVPHESRCNSMGADERTRIL